MEGASIPRQSPLQITHHITLCARDLEELPVSDHLESYGIEPEEADNWLDRYSEIECIMRTPPKDPFTTVVSYFSFMLNRIGVAALPIEATNGVDDKDQGTPA